MLNIGEFARLGQVSPRMLRHYDEFGLLTPDRVDPASGYRLYRVQQLGRLHRIVALRDIGFGVYEPDGTYFINADIAPLGESDATEFCRNLPDRAGVVAIPSAVFYDDHPEAGRTLVRFAFCKRPEVLKDALSRLSVLARS